MDIGAIIIIIFVAIILILTLTLCIIISFSCAYNAFKSQEIDIKNFNNEYEYYYNKEIYGAELATIINKITNNNTKYNIQKDEKGNFIEDTQNSIKMDIYIIDSDTVYSIERISPSLTVSIFSEPSSKYKCIANACTGFISFFNSICIKPPFK